MASDRKRAAANPAPPEAAGKLPAFEQAIERLETIVDELESGSLTLEESIARYEEGMRLSKHLTKTLDEAEKRIERLTENEQGEPATEPMELDSRPAEDAPPEGKLPF